MDILLVGMSHKTAPVEFREMFYVSEEALPNQLGKLQGRTVPECLIISTCNRFEILAHCKDVKKAAEEIKALLSSDKEVPPHDLEPYLYILEGEQAIKHIFRVASSLDSMVVGEPQILGQIKNAYTIAFENKTTGIILGRLMHKAFSVAKRVKTETKIACSAVSISYAAVELAKKVFADLSAKTVMLVGAGEMGELAARHLLQNGAKRILVTNRTYSRAVTLAEEFGGSAVPFEEFIPSLVEVDILITSTGSSEYILHHHDVKTVLRKRKKKPIFMIDIAVPRDLDPEINKIDNVYIYDIDDLQAVVDANIEEREKEAEKAEEIVSQEVRTFLRWLDSLDATPVIMLLRERLEQIRRDELNKSLGRLTGISENDKNAIDAMSKSIINKVLHGPMVALKSPANGEEKEALIHVIKEIFRLEDSRISPS